MSVGVVGEVWACVKLHVELEVVTVLSRLSQKSMETLASVESKLVLGEEADMESER